MKTKQFRSEFGNDIIVNIIGSDDFRYSVDSSLLKSLGWEEKHTNFNENIEHLISLIA